MTTKSELIPATSDIAQRINTEHRACVTAANDALQHAIRCGELLVEAKSSLPHGGLQKWLADHFAGSARTARVYMRLAAHRSQILAKWQTSAGLSIAAALKTIALPAPDPFTEALRCVEEFFVFARAQLRRPDVELETVLAIQKEAFAIQQDFAEYTVRLECKCGQLLTPQPERNQTHGIDP